MQPTHALGPSALRCVIWLIAVWGVLGLPHHSAAQAPASTAPTQLPAVEVRGQRLGVEQVVSETSTFGPSLIPLKLPPKSVVWRMCSARAWAYKCAALGGWAAFSTVSIRGSNPNQVEVYLDNVLQNPANAGLVDLGSLPLDNVERIEIYRSFAPMQLGAGSIGGAINLVTRPVAGETTNLVNTSYGSFDTRKVTLYRSQGFDQLGYLVLFNYMGSAGDFTFLDDNGTRFNTLDDQVTTRRNNDFNAFNINAKGEAIVRAGRSRCPTMRLSRTRVCQGSRASNRSWLDWMPGAMSPRYGWRKKRFRGRSQTRLSSSPMPGAVNILRTLRAA